MRELETTHHQHPEIQQICVPRPKSTSRTGIEITGFPGYFSLGFHFSSTTHTHTSGTGWYYWSSFILEKVSNNYFLYQYPKVGLGTG
jgi:hypothetical protein